MIDLRNLYGNDPIREGAFLKITILLDTCTSILDFLNQRDNLCGLIASLGNRHRQPPNRSLSTLHRLTAAETVHKRHSDATFKIMTGAVHQCA